MFSDMWRLDKKESPVHSYLEAHSDLPFSHLNNQLYHMTVKQMFHSSILKELI